MREWSSKKFARRGAEHSQWKGGVSKTKDGYIKVNLNLADGAYHEMADKSGWILQHRLVMAKKLGRPLLSTELVHHKDGDKLNNNEDNLELTDRRKHMKDHNAFETLMQGKRSAFLVLCSDGRAFISVAAAATGLGCDPGTIHRHLKKGTPYKNVHFSRAKSPVKVSLEEIVAARIGGWEYE